MAIKQYLEKLLAQNDLTFEEAGDLLDSVFAGDVPAAQVAAFLTALRIKGETVEELAGLAGSLRDHAVKVETGIDNLVDTCGTGGAKLKTFNISTASAFVAAGAGVHVAKHGNRGITSNCGSADVLEALGVNIAPGAEIVARCIKEANVGFMFAPMYHPAMKYVQPVRKELGFRTAFNLLGPLANPARATAPVRGVADVTLLPTIAEILTRLGIKHAMVVHSEGLDEISTMSPTKILHLKGGEITPMEIKPEDFSMATASFDDLKGAGAQANAEIVRDIIAGNETGPKKDIVVINAAAAIIVAGLADDFKAAIEKADESITSGKANKALQMLVKISNLS
jgi:anthranilate phosphoribosyltransferase